MAKELLEINKIRNTISLDLLKAHCALFLSRLKEIRINYMKNQIEAILTRGAINERKHSDMRFSSIFSQEIIKTNNKPVSVKKKEEKKLPMIKIIEKPINYSFNNKRKQKYKIQEKIINIYSKRFWQETIDYIKTSKI